MRDYTISRRVKPGQWAKKNTTGAYIIFQKYIDLYL